ncbi:MAG: PEP-CTERM sorting domain-containing protein [Planctomycetes bacterium]|nr:PEP-CTERM sorting domain-containing protein [Planctomycetota bacterium]
MTRRKSLFSAAALAATLILVHSASAVSVPVPNFSFEDGALGDGVAVPSWTANHIVGNHSIRNSAGVGGFQATDGTKLLTFRTGGGSPDGTRSYSSLRQTLGESIDTSQIYTLTVDVGHYDPAFFGGPAGLELYWNNAGTPTRIAATASVPGSFGNKTYNLQVSGTELAGLSGQALGIRLFTSQEGTNFHVAYDNVRLNKVTAPTPSGNPTAITVPDFSFEISGGNDNSWTINPQVWGGGGWPISGTGYGQAATDGVDKGVNTAYQLLTDTFVEGATYTLTLDHSLRGDAGQEFDTGSIMFFRQDQNPGGPTTAFAGPTIAMLDGSLSNGNNPAGLNGAGDWVTQTLTYVATSADDGQRIGIMVARVTGYQPVWDNVRLTVDLAEAEAVPEPSTYALGLLGLGGLGLAVWKKRKSK